MNYPDRRRSNGKFFKIISIVITVLLTSIIGALGWSVKRFVAELDQRDQIAIVSLAAQERHLNELDRRYEMIQYQHSQMMNIQSDQTARLQKIEELIRKR